MATYGGEEVADKTVALRPDVKRRLESARSYPREPFWSVINRLLDEHDSRYQGAGATPSGSAPPAPPSAKPGVLSRVFRRDPSDRVEAIPA